ncbi:VOC family protein [Metabacillus sp. KIGAM252]|uniref:VOC family protein n=1 Tax=Metabacillus flavus TaxID=2823519 RepID=A0ABS5LCJ7_9BACI|nr:VOC family protein [Metabacillus flavus]MBS2968437.1 VOC family protein [Metabacillus flavus]
MKEDWKPEGYSSVSPYLIVSNAQAVIEFAEKVLNGTAHRRKNRQDGSIMHVELKIDDSVVMLGEATENWSGAQNHLHVYVPDVHATYNLAVEAGYESVQEPEIHGDEPDKRAGILDPCGNTWWIATQVK